MLYRFSEFRLDTLRSELSRADHVVAIPRRAFDLLLLLIRNRDRVLSKDELTDALWPDSAVAESSLFECVAVARRALGSEGAKLIRTVHRRGYTFAGRVEEAQIRTVAPASASPGTLFVGRADSVGAFEDALEAAQRPGRRSGQQGSVLLLGGGPGLGKSRLLHELAAAARNAGCAVALGRCSEVEGAPAYWPWVQVLRELRKQVPKAASAALWSEVMVLDPARHPGEPTFSGDDGSARFRLFDTVGEVLRRTTREQTTVILLDDMHRADLPSLRLLAYLAEELAPLRLVVVAAHREFELAEDAERSAVFARIVREPCARALRLEGLTREEVGQLAGSIVDGDVAESLAARLHEHTDGNPFFVTQVLTLATRQDLEEGRELPRDLPPTVRAAVLRHLDALPEDTRRLLAIAAVLGRGFDVAALAQTSRTAEDDALARLAPAVAAAVIRAPSHGGGRYWFRHILVRDALYDQWSKEDQAGWHLNAARTLQQRHGAMPGAHVAELAAHFLKAAPMGAVDEAVRYAMAAGRWAREQLAFEESAVRLQQAAELDDLHSVLSAAERCDLLMDLGAAYNGCGMRAAARRILEEAAQIAGRLDDGRRLARAALTVSPGFFAIEAGVEDRSLVALLELALLHCPPGETALRSQLLCRLALAILWAPESARRHALADEASSLAVQVNDPWVAAHAAVARFLAYWSADDVDDRSHQADRIVIMAESAGDPELGLMGRVLRISTLLENGDVAGFSREVRSLRHIVETGRHPQASWYPVLYDATLALIEGRLTEADERVKTYAEMGERFGDLNAATSLAAHLIVLNWQRGRLTEAIDLARFAARRPHAIPAHRAAMALFSSLGGHREEALGEVRRLCAEEFAAIPRDLVWLFAVTALGEAVAHLGSRELARSCYQQLVPYSSRYATAGYGLLLWGPVDRTLGLLATLLGEYEQAEEHFRRALEMCDRIGARVISVATRLDWAKLLAARDTADDRSRKSAMCRGALREAREMHLVYYEKELETVLAQP